MKLVLFIALWLASSIIVSQFAANKGRNRENWFLLAFVFSPLLASIALAMLPPKERG